MEDQSRKESRPEKRRKWASHIQAWRGSGKSQAQYCREQGLSAKLFYYWKNKNNGTSGDVGVKLVPVDMPRIKYHSSEEVESSLVLVVGQYKVEIGDRFDPGTLARLVQTLDHI
mgnify:CR=1 FL=1